MSQSPVHDILEMIDTLTDSDRELLQQELAQRAETEWRGAAEKARRQASARGIDQAAIDEAIRQVRHGS